MLDDLDLTSITDEGTRELVVRLLNLIETLAADLRATQGENQRLRDEINRLKGEQGKPSVKPGTKPTAMDHSSEPERRQSKPREKGRKVQQLFQPATLSSCQLLGRVLCHQLPSQLGCWSRRSELD